MPQPRVRPQRRLFDDPPAVPAVRLPVNIQEQLRHVLVQWLRAVATTIRAGGSDDQDHR
jgi:hypothetical protein